MSALTSEPPSLLASVASLSLSLTLAIASCTHGERDLGEAITTDAGSGFHASPDAGRTDAEQPVALCTSTTCPAPYGTCPTDAFRCETNFDTDDDNCGACGVKCAHGYDVREFYGAEWRCQSGTCKMTCDPQRRLSDCNHDVADGCETDTACDPNNCGTCGVRCPDGLACRQGTCGCPAGLTDCGTNTCSLAFDCVLIEMDDWNCGACGNVCPEEPPPFPNTKIGCVDSECGKLKCEPFFEDCNHDRPKDGCEVNLLEDAENCGACGKRCGPGQWCFGGQCKCAPSETACSVASGLPMCADLDTDPYNCGVCNNYCPWPPDGSAEPVCRRGRCELACPVGYADCDGRAENGCETMIAADPNNCGGCGVQCDLAAGQPCVNGTCRLVPCESGGTQ